MVAESVRTYISEVPARTLEDVADVVEVVARQASFDGDAWLKSRSEWRKKSRERAACLEGGGCR